MCVCAILDIDIVMKPKITHGRIVTFMKFILHIQGFPEIPYNFDENCDIYYVEFLRISWLFLIVYKIFYSFVLLSWYYCCDGNALAFKLEHYDQNWNRIVH